MCQQQFKKVYYSYLYPCQYVCINETHNASLSDGLQCLKAAFQKADQFTWGCNGMVATYNHVHKTTVSN